MPGLCAENSGASSVSVAGTGSPAPVIYVPRDVPDAARPGSGSPVPGGEDWTDKRLPRIPSQTAGPPLGQGQGPGRARERP